MGGAQNNTKRVSCVYCNWEEVHRYSNNTTKLYMSGNEDKKSQHEVMPGQTVRLAQLWHQVYVEINITRSK